jgi:hypothetical protein
MVMLATAPKDEARAAEASTWVSSMPLRARGFCRGVLQSHPAGSHGKRFAPLMRAGECPSSAGPAVDRARAAATFTPPLEVWWTVAARWVDEILSDEYGDVGVGSFGMPFSGADHAVLVGGRPDCYNRCTRATRPFHARETRKLACVTRALWGVYRGTPIGRSTLLLCRG